MFASVGADGSVRMFDLRHLEHSTIIYEVILFTFYHIAADLILCFNFYLFSSIQLRLRPRKSVLTRVL